MKRVLPLAVLLFVGCSIDDEPTGSSQDQIEPSELSVSVVDISADPSETALDTVVAAGTVKNDAGFPLSGLFVQAVIYSNTYAVVATQEATCVPDSVGPGGTATFRAVVTVSVPYRETRSILLTPWCDQGAGETAVSRFSWPE